MECCYYRQDQHRHRVPKGVGLQNNKTPHGVDGVIRKGIIRLYGIESVSYMYILDLKNCIE